MIVVAYFFAVMFVAASGMVFAVDQVGALFDGDGATECTADAPVARRAAEFDFTN